VQYGCLFYNVYGAVGTTFTGRQQARKIVPAPYIYA
jgi:hypothetical protein